MAQGIGIISMACRPIAVARELKNIEFEDIATWSSFLLSASMMGIFFLQRRSKILKLRRSSKDNRTSGMSCRNVLSKRSMTLTMKNGHIDDGLIEEIKEKTSDEMFSKPLNLRNKYYKGFLGALSAQPVSVNDGQSEFFRTMPILL
ncbi:unnamed protein product [Urochloa humidicola]